MCLHMLHMLMPMLMMVVSSFACLSFTILLNSLSARTLADDDGGADDDAGAADDDDDDNDDVDDDDNVA